MDGDAWHDERAALVVAGAAMAAKGLVIGSAGNLSTHVAGHVVITATGADLATMTIDDTVVVAFDGTAILGVRRPSSELPLHLGVYRARPSTTAIAHAHAIGSTAVGCVVADELPALHYACLQLGGPPRVARYATFGSDELAAGVAMALGDDRHAALMQNHGSVAVGSSLAEAVTNLEMLEWLCQLHLAAHSLGAPRVLDADELGAAHRALAARQGAIDSSSANEG